MNTIPLDDDFEQILISAERYALGRMTYIVEMTVNYIMPLIPRLSGGTLCVMLTDIQKETNLGMEFDAKAWHSLEQTIVKEIEKREEAVHGE